MIVGIIVVIVIISVLLLLIAYEKATNAVCTSKRRLEGKTVIVTGGTSGIGLEIAKDLAERGARVIIACPFKEEGLNAEKEIKKESENDNVVFKILDLASLESTRQFAADIIKNEERLDILINNAGLTADAALTKDNLILTMQVNYFGAFLLTILLLPLLRKSGKPGDPSRIVNTASRMHIFGSVNIKELNKFQHQFHLYSNSKLCLMLFSHELNKNVQEWNVTVNSLHPGTVGTHIFSGWLKRTGGIVSFIIRILLKTPFLGAQTAIHASVDEKAGELSGVYFANCRVAKPSKKARDDKLSEDLWAESIRLVKLSKDEIDECFKL